MMHAVSILLDDNIQVLRKLGPADRLKAAYALADEAALELKLASSLNEPMAHRLMVRAHLMSYAAVMGKESARDYLKSLLPDLADDTTDWDQVPLR